MPPDDPSSLTSLVDPPEVGAVAVVPLVVPLEVDTVVVPALVDPPEVAADPPPLPAPFPANTGAANPNMVRAAME